MATQNRATPRFPIGEMARQAQCQVQAIRYYEQIGILPRPARTEGGHRLYTLEHMERLQFVRRSRELGFSLDAVRELLTLADKRGDDCATVDRITSQHLTQVQQKISQLRALEVELERMVKGCSHGKIATCRIIEALSDG